MNSEMTSKNDLYKAIGLTVLLLTSALPLGILGMQLLNLVLGNIQE